MKHDLYGVSKIEIGAPGDGVMGTIFDEYLDIVKDSVSLVMPEPDTVEIYSETEQTSPYKIIPKQSEGAKLEFALYGVDMSKFPDFLGGTWDDVNKKWIAPRTLTVIYKSVRITTSETDAEGNKLAVEMPYASIVAGIDGKLSSENLASLKVTCKAQVPIAADGTKGDPLVIAETV